jgi:hypothetical protein
MATVITYFTWRQIQDSARRKRSPPRIAGDSGLDVKTVRKWIGRAYGPRQRSHRHSKLDPFKERIACFLKSRPFNSQKLFQYLREEGFDGCFSIVKDYLHTIKPITHEAFDAHKWILAVLQKEISPEELKSQMGELGEIDTLLNALYEGRLSERKKSLSVIAGNYGIRAETICSA